jgi:hypothetical protein
MVLFWMVLFVVLDAALLAFTVRCERVRVKSLPMISSSAEFRDPRLPKANDG